MKILNTWTSKKGNLKFYHESREVYRNGDYRIFAQPSSYLYTYRNVAINCLCGKNKKHLDALANDERPKGEYTPSHFIYDSAIKSKKKGLILLESNG